MDIILLLPEEYVEFRCCVCSEDAGVVLIRTLGEVGDWGDFGDVPYMGLRPAVRSLPELGPIPDEIQ